MPAGLTNFDNKLISENASLSFNMAPLMRVELQKDKELEEPLIDLARMPQNSKHPLRFSSHSNPKTYKEEMKEGEESFPIPDKSRSGEDVQMRP